MKKSEFTRKDFNKLLNLLDSDKEIAAEKYQSLHNRLVQIFLQRKAFPAEELADKTIDIAIQKIDFLTDEYKGNPLNYFYSIAQNLILENLRIPKNEVLKEDLLQFDPRKSNENFKSDCLKDCLEELPSEQKRLLIKYFRYTKSTKIKLHKKLAEEVDIDVSHLRTKVYRLKKGMEKCIKKCVRKKNGDFLAKKNIYK